MVNLRQNLLPYFGLIDERVNNSEKEEPVQITKIGENFIKMDDMNHTKSVFIKYLPSKIVQ